MWPIFSDKKIATISNGDLITTLELYGNILNTGS